MRIALIPKNRKSAWASIFAVAAVLIALSFFMMSDGNSNIARAQTPDGDAPKYANMDGLLNELAEQHEAGGLSASASAANASAASGSSSGGGSVGVIFLTQGDASDGLREFLLENGASPGPAYDGFIGADVPVSLLASASRQAGVEWMHAAVPPKERGGSALSGVQPNGHEAWHRGGVKGEGVKIGVISLGFEGFQDLMGTELPASVTARCYAGFGIYTSDIADCETVAPSGTAIASEVYDIAPDATYYVALINDWIELNETIKWMAQEEVDVVISNISFVWTGPGDGTSPYPLSDLNTVALAVEEGITWITGAGDEARSTWLGDFTDPDANEIHNFSENDECNSIELEAGDLFYGIIRWEDSWPISAKDIDIFLIDEESSRPLRKSRRSWLGASSPMEFLYFAPFFDGAYCLQVMSKGEPPEWIQLQSFVGPELEYHTLSGSVNSPGESNSDGLLAVGATAWNNTDEILERSGRGPTTDGRIKPDVVGGPGGSSDSLERWYGSAQASAQVAGLAALVKQRFPEFVPEEVAAYLKDNALDRGEPGPDNTWGYGYAFLPASDGAKPPSKDACIQRIYSTLSLDGEWDDTCISENRPNDEETPYDPEEDYYARFYTFAVSADRKVTISLSSEEDTYLYLMKGAGKDGEIVALNDDITPYLDFNSALVVDGLEAGDYTIEATTYKPGVAAEFTLGFGIGDAAIPQRPAPPPSAHGPFNGFSRGADHVCALRSNGAIACWGADKYGQATPPRGEFTRISSGENGSCALRDDGAVVCWGSLEVSPSTEPAASGPFTDVSRGSDHACALDSDGAITCWGANRHGQRNPPDGEFSAISSSEHGSCALRNDDALICWGSFEVGP